MTITLDEFINTKVDTLMSKILVRKIQGSVIKKIKDDLKGYFKYRPYLIKTGTLIKVDNYELELVELEKTKSKVGFKVKDTDTFFTIKTTYLLGAELKIPFKVGDEVIYKDEICKVLQIFPNEYKVEIQ